jgi:hypothetical protein
MKRRPIYVEVLIKADLERIWELTQNTDLHPQWDARFSAIQPFEEIACGGSRFRYEARLPFHIIHGVGTSLGERRRADGTRTSALKFTTADRLSPLGAGRGYWRYVPSADGVRFITGYDYEPAWGAILDYWVIRPFVGWMTAWSFDRLRIWAESEVEPSQLPIWTVLAWWKPLRPKAKRTLRQPPRGRVMDDAPATLDTLEAP